MEKSLSDVVEATAKGRDVLDNTGEQINIFEMLPEISQLILAGFWSHMPK